MALTLREGATKPASERGAAKESGWEWGRQLVVRLDLELLSSNLLTSPRSTNRRTVGAPGCQGRPGDVTKHYLAIGRCRSRALAHAVAGGPG